MKNLLTIIFTTIITVLVIMMLLLIVFFGYLFIKNPFGVGDLVKARIFNSENNEITVDENYDHPLLSADQEKQLIDMGLDPAKIPTEITPELQECVTSKVSEQRIQEIIGGSEPSVWEIGKILPCL